MWYQMEWYQIAGTVLVVYVEGFIICFLIYWFGLLYIDEDPRGSEIFIAVKSLAWIYFLPAFLGMMITQRQFLSASEKIGKKKQGKEVGLEKEREKGR